MLQTIVNFKKDLDLYTDREVLSIAKMYDLSGSPNDLRWIIAIRHASQNAQMLSGGVMSFVEKLPALIPVFKTRGENIAIDKNYVDKLLQLIREQKQFKKNLKKMSMEEKQKRESELNQIETQLKRHSGWETIQGIRQMFDNIPQQYFDWTIKSYIDGSINRLEDIPSRLKPAIDDFAWLKKNNKIAKEIDIRKLNDLVGLEDFLDDYEDELQSRHKVVEGKLIYDGKDIKIIQPLTEAGACYYGKGTKWCTTATKSENFFDSYNKEGPLYIIQPKNPGRGGKEKYQLHFEDTEFKDENDKNVDITKLIQQYPEIEVLINLIKDQDINISVWDIETFISLYDLGFQNKIVQIKLQYVKNIVLDFISKNITEFTKLSTLSILLSGITVIPDNISLLNLKSLSLGTNEITTIPRSIGDMQSLETLDLSDNQITEIPTSLTKLKNLKKLILGTNEITTIPRSIGDMQSLEVLELNGNKITEIPDTISNLHNLKTLDLEMNKITDIPDTISNLPNLKKLQLEMNKITAIPDSIREMKGLELKI